MKCDTAATKIGSMCTNMTELATEVKLRLVIQEPKCSASTIPTATRLSRSLLEVALSLLNDPKPTKKGKRIKVEKIRRYEAIANGAEPLILIKIEAVDTATMLMNSAALGEKAGGSLTTLHADLSHLNN
jgi:hypothetical protein